MERAGERCGTVADAVGGTDSPGDVLYAGTQASSPSSKTIAPLGGPFEETLRGRRGLRPRRSVPREHRRARLGSILARCPRGGARLPVESSPLDRLLGAAEALARWWRETRRPDGKAPSCMTRRPPASAPARPFLRYRKPQGEKTPRYSTTAGASSAQPDPWRAHRTYSMPQPGHAHRRPDGWSTASAAGRRIARCGRAVLSTPRLRPHERARTAPARTRDPAYEVHRQRHRAGADDLVATDRSGQSIRHRTAAPNTSDARSRSTAAARDPRSGNRQKSTAGKLRTMTRVRPATSCGRYAQRGAAHRPSMASTAPRWRPSGGSSAREDELAVAATATSPPPTSAASARCHSLIGSSATRPAAELERREAGEAEAVLGGHEGTMNRGHSRRSARRLAAGSPPRVGEGTRPAVLAYLPAQTPPSTRPQARRVLRPGLALTTMLDRAASNED